jgi:hypothetical protein
VQIAAAQDAAYGDAACRHGNQQRQHEKSKRKRSAQYIFSVIAYGHLPWLSISGVFSGKRWNDTLILWRQLQNPARQFPPWRAFPPASAARGTANKPSISSGAIPWKKPARFYGSRPKVSLKKLTLGLYQRRAIRLRSRGPSPGLESWVSEAKLQTFIAIAMNLMHKSLD